MRVDWPPRSRVWLSGDDAHARLLRFALAGAAIAAGLRIFGLPPVPIHGPYHWFGLMSPSCGLTRATRFLALGDLHDAWRFNPAVFVLAAADGLVLGRHALGRVTRRWVNVTLAHPRLVYTTLAVPLAVLWSNQQLHAALLK